MKKMLLMVASMAIVLGVNAQAVKVSTAGNVGIGTGTTTPSQKLHVVGNTYLNGNVGIGYTSPTYKLQVNGNSYFNGKGYFTNELNVQGKVMMDCSYSTSIVSRNEGIILGWSDLGSANGEILKRYPTISAQTNNSLQIGNPANWAKMSNFNTNLRYAF
jgi:hypothetical protein